MKIDTQINVEKSVKPENLEAFKDAVKHFIDTDYGRQYGFELEPSNEWKFIRKVRYTRILLNVMLLNPPTHDQPQTTTDGRGDTK